MWARGIVHVGDPRKLPGRVPPRRLAAYLSKYVTKQHVSEDGELLEDRAPGEHRYFITQGFTPTTWRFRVRTIGQADELLRMLIGEPDVRVDLTGVGEWVLAGEWLSYPDACLHPPPRWNHVEPS